MNQILQEDSGHVATLVSFPRRVWEVYADENREGGFLSVCHTSILSSQFIPLVKPFICFPLFLAQVPPLAFLLLYSLPLAPGAGKQEREELELGFSSW